MVELGWKTWREAALYLFAEKCAKCPVKISCNYKTCESCPTALTIARLSGTSPVIGKVSEQDKISKIRKLKSYTQTFQCQCGETKVEKWLEAVNGSTGIYCKGCGKRLSSGFPIDYQFNLLKNSPVIGKVSGDVEK